MKFVILLLFICSARHPVNGRGRRQMITVVMLNSEQ